MVERNIDIASNVHMIEILKAQIASETANIFNAALKADGKEDLVDAVANVILLSYVLGRRFGADYEDIDKRVEDKAKIGILDEHKLEKDYKDLSTLKKRIAKR